MSLFVASKRAARRPGRARSFRFESLQRRTLMAADPVGMVPDFHLVDVNPNSATYNTEFSPRDLLGQTGALYFAHST